LRKYRSIVLKLAPGCLTNWVIAGLTLNVNGQAIALDGQGRATVQYATAQSLNVVATAVDGAGNSGNSAPLTVNVFNPNITFNPNVAFNLPDVVKAPTEFTINGSGLSTYQLDVISINTGGLCIREVWDRL
jgi:hypothetical protein